MWIKCSERLPGLVNHESKLCVVKIQKSDINYCLAYYGIYNIFGQRLQFIGWTPHTGNDFNMLPNEFSSSVVAWKCVEELMDDKFTLDQVMQMTGLTFREILQQIAHNKFPRMEEFLWNKETIEDWIKDNPKS